MFYLYCNGDLISVCEHFSEIYNILFYDIFDESQSDVDCWIQYFVDDIIEKRHANCAIGDFSIEVWHG